MLTPEEIRHAIDYEIMCLRRYDSPMRSKREWVLHKTAYFRSGGKPF